MKPILIAGYRASCDMWAYDDQIGRGFVLVSFLGVYTVLQALWGTLIAGRVLELEDRTLLHRIPRGDKNEYPVRYRHNIARFPQIEQAQLVMIIESATLDLQSEQRAYLFNPDVERFFAFWNKCLIIPAREEWASFLLKEGLRRGCVRKIPSYGCEVLAIEPDPEPWAQIILGGIEDKTIT